MLFRSQPATFEVHVLARAKYACKSCDREARPGQLATTPAPPTPIPGGIPTSSLLADVVIRKYLDHTPINRLVGIYARSQVELARSTVYGWALAVAAMMESLAKRIHDKALEAHVLQVDDTGVVVLDKTAEGGSKRGHFWSCLGDGLWAAYHYTPDWTAEGPEAFLSTRVGWMQADGYAGFDRLYVPAGGTAIEVACWAHARRYYVKAKEAGDFRAARPLRLIQKLFRIERRATEDELTPEERLARRKKESYPLLELGQWISKTSTKAPPDEPLGRAITDTVNQHA